MFAATPKFRWSASGTIKIVCDGNSITAAGQDGAESVNGVVGYLNRHTAPFSLQSIANVAIGGQNTDNMISSSLDVDSAFDSSKINILFAQEGTNQNTTDDTPLINFEKFKSYVAARRAVNPWSAVIVATAPPAYLGDSFTQTQTNVWNAKMDAYNVLLRERWWEFADRLIETRKAGGPYDQARYPDYLRATFFSTTPINGISNTATWTNEGNQIRIHYSAAGIAAMAPLFAEEFLRAPKRIWS